MQKIIQCTTHLDHTIAQISCVDIDLNLNLFEYPLSKTTLLNSYLAFLIS